MIVDILMLVAQIAIVALFVFGFCWTVVKINEKMYGLDKKDKKNKKDNSSSEEETLFDSSLEEKTSKK